MSVALDSVMETQAAQLNLLLYHMYRPYFNGRNQIYFLASSYTSIESLNLSRQFGEKWKIFVKIINEV